METKKIKVLGFWGWRDHDEHSPEGWKEFDPEDNLFTRILRERYNLEFCDDPDYLITSESGAFPYAKYDAVRILYTGEPFAPDFNVFDYAIGSEYVNYPDEQGKNRYFRFPYCFYNYQKYMPYISEFEAQPYGTPKQTNYHHCKCILIDDNAEVRQAFETPHRRKTFDANEDICEFLTKLYEELCEIC